MFAATGKMWAQATKTEKAMIRRIESGKLSQSALEGMGKRQGVVGQAARYAARKRKR